MKTKMHKNSIIMRVETITLQTKKSLKHKNYSCNLPNKSNIYRFKIIKWQKKWSRWRSKSNRIIIVTVFYRCHKQVYFHRQGKSVNLFQLHVLSSLSKKITRIVTKLAKIMKNAFPKWLFNMKLRTSAKHKHWLNLRKMSTTSSKFLLTRSPPQK